MWILTKDKRQAFDVSKMYSFFVSDANGFRAAVRCGFDSGQKAMTLGEYATTETAEAVLVELMNVMARNAMCGTVGNVIFMPNDGEASAILQRHLVGRAKERAANGKKPVRRGGS